MVSLFSATNASAGCFRAFFDMIDWCNTWEGYFTARGMVCRADAELDLIGCVRGKVLGGLSPVDEDDEGYYDQELLDWALANAEGPGGVIYDGQ